jgi:hypothetical protein
MDSAHIYASARRGLQRINGVTKLTNKAVCKSHTIQRLGLNHVEKEQQSRSDQEGSNAIQNIHFLIASSRKGVSNKRPCLLNIINNFLLRPLTTNIPPSLSKRLCVLNIPPTPSNAIMRGQQFPLFDFIQPFQSLHSFSFLFGYPLVAVVYLLHICSALTRYKARRGKTRALGSEGVVPSNGLQLYSSGSEVCEHCFAERVVRANGLVEDDCERGGEEGSKVCEDCRSCLGREVAEAAFTDE